MSEPSLGVAVGFQVFDVISVLLLLGSWIIQFQRMTGKDTELPPVETGSLMMAGFAIFVCGLESADPLGRWDLIQAYNIRLMSVMSMTCNAVWLIFNGTFQASLLLVVVGLKLKDNHEGDDIQWDVYTKAKYSLCFIWMIMAVILIIFSFTGDQDQFILIYILGIILGVLGSAGFTIYGLKAAYAKKLGSREIGINDVRKNARRKIAAQLFEVIGYHIALLAILLTDLGLGAPSKDEVSGHLVSILMVYSVANRLFIIFELWFHWYPVDERDFKQKLEDRRSEYKIISVERMIDQRIKLEQEKQRSGMQTVISGDVLKATIIFSEEEEEDVRTRGFTEQYMAKEAVRLGKGSRKKEIDEAAVPAKKTPYGKNLGVDDLDEKS